MQIITRDEAIQLGLRRYFTGNPCVHGHMSERVVSTRVCAECKYINKTARNQTAHSKAVNKAHYLKHRERNLVYRRTYYRNNKQRHGVLRKAWVKANDELCKTYKRRWLAKFRNNNGRSYSVTYRERRKQIDPGFRLLCQLRGQFRSWLKRKRRDKDSSLTQWIGCTKQELAAHMESQFHPGMSWSNYGFGKGRWNIDHIRPLASFNVHSQIDQAAAWHYTNLQPLWHDENLKKGCRIQGDMVA